MIVVHYAKGFFKEAERAGYQAMQVTAEQQAAHVPVTEANKRVIETPMDVDQEAKDTSGGVKRKAEEETSEESKKARVGACSLASCL
jgi:squamous cell carcinoma antigen recognized by T-cells 3